MSLPLPISVVVVARNEAHNLPRCLASVGGWCADLVVALNDTRDDSERVARAAGARVEALEWQGYRDTKNAALALGTATQQIMRAGAQFLASFGKNTGKKNKKKRNPEGLR